MKYMRRNQRIIDHLLGIHLRIGQLSTRDRFIFRLGKMDEDTTKAIILIQDRMIEEVLVVGINRPDETE